MAFESHRIVFPRSDFLSLVGTVPIALLTTKLLELSLSTPILEIRPVPGGGVAVDWESFITFEDRLAVQSLIAGFIGEPTTSEPFFTTVAGPILAANATAVLGARLTTPPLDLGTYQFSWMSAHRLTATASATASRALLTVNGALIQRSHWAETFETPFNGSFPIKRTTGQTITAELLIAKIGAGPVSAEMTGIRLGIDKIG